MKATNHYQYHSISDLHLKMNITAPKHPLVSIVNLDDIVVNDNQPIESLMYHFYAVFLKKNFEGKIKYGHEFYDFDNGTMTFYKPQQLIKIVDYKPTKLSGWALVFHPDFIHNYALAKKLKEYGFFSYEAHEALHISEDEEVLISRVLENLQYEIQQPIDRFSQDVIISHIDLFLNYCNRFYNRQFITRKKASNDILFQFEHLFEKYMIDDLAEKGQPNASYFADSLNISQAYLNDMLKSLTGQTVQQYVHQFIIDKAKELLATSNKSTSEIAYMLGFEYAQSFNKLFKNKTNQTPLEFRKLIN